VTRFDDWLDAVREASRRGLTYGHKHRVQRLRAGGFQVIYQSDRRTDYETILRRHMRRCHP